MKYKLSNFNYDLPEKRIVDKPCEQRDEAKMMVLDRNSGEIEHKQVKDLINYFEEDDVIVLNNTKVFPARLYANKEKTGARIEVFLLRELNKKNRLWDVLVDPARVKTSLDLTTNGFLNQFDEGDVAQIFEKVFTEDSSVSVHSVVNIIYIFRALMRIRKK